MTPSVNARLRIAVFASGNGSNFQSIVNASMARTLRAEIALCVSNQREAGVLARAESAGVATAVLRPDQFESEDEYIEALTTELDACEVNFVALAGYLRKIPPDIVRRFRNRMVNIHPALLPAFGGKGMYGRRVHEAVLRYGVRWTGATVHLVDEGYDTGPIVLQEPVPVLPDDTVSDLADRVLKVEHRLYPAALQLFTEGRVRVSDRRVTFDPPLPVGNLKPLQ